MPFSDNLPSVWPLVGRVAELGLMQQLMNDARGGTCRALLIRGESGLGKTRLAQVAMQHAAETGWTVANGSAYAVETGVPYAMFADALVPVLRSLGTAALSMLSRGAASRLGHVFPGLLEGDATHEPPASVELTGRVLWTVTQLLTALSARAPVLVVFENLQWADPSSMEMLHFVARQARGARLAIIATYNDVEHRADGPFDAAVRSLVELGVATCHDLAPITGPDVQDLLGLVFGDGAVPREAVALLFNWTRGNPFFLEQVVKSLVVTGRLQCRNGMWTGWDLEGLALPRSIRDALAMRIARLSADARRAAQSAATIGTRFTRDLLHAVTGMERDALWAALDELCSRNVLAGRADGDGASYDFTHPMVRDTVYDELGIGRRAMLHGRVAEALERIWGDRAVEHAGELAFHAVQASADELTPKEVRYLTIAGETALEKHADREAARYLGAALEHLDRQARESPRGPASFVVRAADVVQRLAVANHRIGNHAAAMSLWERARADASTAGDMAQVARVERRVALAHYWRGHPADGLRHAEAGLRAAIAAESRQLIAQLRVVQGSCLIELGHADDARRALRDALADAEHTGDTALLARVHRALLLAAVVTCSPDDAREHAARTLDLAQRSRQPMVACTAHWALAVLAGLTGNVAELETQLGEAERIADELRSPTLQLSASEVAVEYLAGLGEWTAALARAEQSIALARTIRSQTILARLLVWTAVIYVGRGDFDRAKRYLDEATAIAGMEGEQERHDVNSALRVHMGWAVYHNARGEFDEAIRISRAGLEVAERSGQGIWAIYRLRPALIEANLWKREFDQAENLSRQLREASEPIGHRLGLAWAEIGESVAQMLRGTTPQLLDRVVRAADALARVPFAFDAARLRREIARRYVELGDTATAVRILEAACAQFERMGAALELAGAREQLRALGVRPRSPRAGHATKAKSGVILTARMIDVARLVATGMTNKEVGHALGISNRTVSTTLSEAYRRLKIGSRGQLADWVRRGGLIHAAPQ
ncbi:MAG: helix-turn-helix transcriptional regulator [Gemmatimonadaceae bacterium]